VKTGKAGRSIVFKAALIRGKIIFRALFAALFLAGCSHPLSPPTPLVPVGPNTLAVYIGGAAGRTALPMAPSAYDITVSRSGVTLGSLTSAQAGAGPYLLPLTSPPAAGDTVLVEGYVGGARQFTGSCTLTAGHIAGTPVTITLYPLRDGAGDVSLSVSFPPGSGDDEITAAEVSLYRSLADYQADNVYQFTRYRKNTGDYGQGDDLGPVIPLEYDDLSPGNYVVKIEFFRFRYVRVSRLVQTIIVRGGFTTGLWDNGSNTLTWEQFASSNANLSGISIGGEAVSGFSSGVYSYSVYKPAAPSNTALRVTSGTPGQAITASLNGGAPFSLTGGSLHTFAAGDMKGANSLAVTVTAPDGVTRQTYALGYTYVLYGTEWYVASAAGNDTSGDGTREKPYATVGKALDAIKTDYNSGDGWPGNSTNPVAARINISGEITECVRIEDTSLYNQFPPIVLAGSDTDKIKAAERSEKQPLFISKAEVILGDRLTLTGGNTANGSGGGVYVNNGAFTMNGGIISGNTTNGTGSFNGGGGVAVDGGAFTMNGGIISGNTANGSGGYSGSGGGVYVYNGASFTMNGGSVSGNHGRLRGGGVSMYGGSLTMNGGGVSGNTTGGEGGGVYVYNGDSFTMSGGSVSGNRNSAGKNGGGVYVEGGAAFTMSGGSVSGNSAGYRGGGVYVDQGAFEMSGGSVSGNTTGGEGGGVYVYDGAFTMSGGSVSGNSAANSDGGGVSLAGGTFNMSGGSVGGNSAQYGGGGVFVSSGAFNMSGGSVSGNTIGDGGGGVGMNGGSFSMTGGIISGNKSSGWGGGLRIVGNTGSAVMTGGTISGNTANDRGGGGVYVDNNRSFTLSGGVISGNIAGSGTSGGGVYFSTGNFTMNGGSVSGNSAAADGGGVYFSNAGTFSMSGGTIDGNSAAANGGGICLGGYDTPTFNMSGGSVSGNTAAGGGGVYVNNGTFTMSGGAAVHTGNPVGLGSGRLITLSETLTANPAANIETALGVGTQVLDGSITEGDNYKKFQLNGAGNENGDKIDNEGKIR
jgi:hypothetical protein